MTWVCFTQIILYKSSVFNSMQDFLHIPSFSHSDAQCSNAVNLNMSDLGSTKIPIDETWESISYRLSKVHKGNVPVRPIVLMLNPLSYKLTRHLVKLIKVISGNFVLSVQYFSIWKGNQFFPLHKQLYYG